jgi:hypothetical protein
MAPRKNTKTDPEAAAEVVERTYIERMSSVLTTTPIKTREDQAVKDEVRRALADRDEAVADFVAARIAEGHTFDDINELFALQSQIVPVVERGEKKTRLRWGYQIVERAE